MVKLQSNGEPEIPSTETKSGQSCRVTSKLKPYQSLTYKLSVSIDGKEHGLTISLEVLS